MAMELLRNIQTTLYYIILETLSKSKTNITLTTGDNQVYILPDTTIITSKPVNVYVNGELQTPDKYDVNYIGGQVIFHYANNPSWIVTADYTAPYVYLYDEYTFPGIDNPDLKLPAVAITHDDTYEQGYQLGGGYQSYRMFYIDVFSQSGVQRDDIGERVKMVFDSDLPLIDYNQGFPVLANGYLNPSFNPVSQNLGILYQERIEQIPSRSINIGNVKKWVMTIHVLLSTYR